MLKEILARLLGHTTAPALPAQPQTPPTDLPNIGRLTQATLDAVKNNQIPQDNLDGTFNNLQPNKGAVFQEGGHWQAPLLPGKVTPLGVAYYDPLATNDRYTNDTYMAVPINPAAVPKPLPYLPYAGGAR